MMHIKTKVVVGDIDRTQKNYGNEISDAMADGWIIALEKHKKGMSFCILYKEGK